MVSSLSPISRLSRRISPSSWTKSVPAERVEALIRQTGGKTVTDVRLFDVYRGEQIGVGKKSLAYSLTYQSDKTMTDAEAAAIRNKIVKRLEYEVGAKLRS